MRPNNNNQNKRSRGRNNNNNSGRKHSNPLSRNYESNGPDVKIRGNASHIAEKYQQLARDAQSSGDSVMAENYFQHAEHYSRIVSAAQALNPQRVEQPVQSSDDDDGDQDNASETAQAVAPVAKPVAVEADASASADSAKAEAPAGEDAPEPRKPRERRPRRKPVKREAEASDASGDVDAPSELPAFLTNGQTTAAE